ncbi:MAG: hypothetical protein C3F08_10030 [Candidatus Methylomirabilota bacterium]|nr:MAG: hypothetical protein C3F08_10030 [candidate division NC10 bacterium]
MKLSDDVRREAQILIARRLGLAFPEDRHADLERGLARAVRGASMPSPDAYLSWLAALPDESPEWRRLAAHLTVGETYFFRDQGCFEALEQQILPDLIAARRSAGNLRLRLWSAACATGEEPYSLAILLDCLLPDLADWVLTILATDINPEALESARRGLYRQWSLRETPAWIRDRYFHRQGGETLEVDLRIRRMVTFAPLNLAEDGYPSVVTNTTAMDLIFCRNVLMYFTDEAQRASVGRLQRALLPEGWLVVSPAEASIDLLKPLTPVNFRGAILYRKEQPSAVSPQPSAIVPSPPFAFPHPPSPNPQPPLDRARALADQGNLEEAWRLCTRALAQNGLDTEAYLLLAAICQERGEIAEALQALRRVIYLAPDSASAYFLMGSLLFRQGKRSQGRRSMETVVNLLQSVPSDEAVAGSDGLTAGRLLETAREYLELRS